MSWTHHSSLFVSTHSSSAPLLIFSHSNTSFPPVVISPVHLNTDQSFVSHTCFLVMYVFLNFLHFQSYFWLFALSLSLHVILNWNLHQTITHHSNQQTSCHRVISTATPFNLNVTVAFSLFLCSSMCKAVKGAVICHLNQTGRFRHWRKLYRSVAAKIFAWVQSRRFL